MELQKKFFNIYKDYANNTEYFSTTAIAKKNQYDAYVSVGFSDEQSMSLVLNDAKKLEEKLNKLSSGVKSKK